MPDLAIKNCNPNTSERQLRDQILLRAPSTPSPGLSALYALCSLKGVSKLFFKNIWTLISKFCEHSQHMHMYLCVSYLDALV